MVTILFVFIKLHSTEQDSSWFSQDNHKIPTPTSLQSVWTPHILLFVFLNPGYKEKSSLTQQRGVLCGAACSWAWGCVPMFYTYFQLSSLCLWSHLYYQTMQWSEGVISGALPCQWRASPVSVWSGLANFEGLSAAPKNSLLQVSDMEKSKSEQELSRKPTICMNYPRSEYFVCFVARARFVICRPKKQKQNNLQLVLSDRNTFFWRSVKTLL